MHRRAILVNGVVQGVGFRPFVFGLARHHGLCGFVRNQVGGVLIEVEGESCSVEAFLDDLTTRRPRLAQIDEVRCIARAPQGDSQFLIEESDTVTGVSIRVAADIAVCGECLAELWDPDDRRYRYPFINCTNCGPRLTIVDGMPYDRERTTMAAFSMCARCRQEYEDPSNRRFHAQPICCPSCGPHLDVLDGAGERIMVDDPLGYAAEAICKGAIGAVKGIGGYHLACHALLPETVSRLRQRKHRDEKPFAIMVADLSHAEALCEVSDRERALLLSQRGPIVLLRKRPGASVAEEVAPRNPVLGVMLPYTPLHHLLLRELDRQPVVMTSGNQSDEPIVYQDRDVVSRLGRIADFYLTHNRPIQLRCDDSVTRIVAGDELPLRRSRGDAPRSLRLPMACRRPMLALGGQLKCTFCLGQRHDGILSHHVGDLNEYAAYHAYVEAIGHYEQLYAVEPELLVHDLHPDYASTRYALSRGSNTGLQRLAVQHHHAHMASCMAEHGLDEPVIGVSFDGTGFGTDGAVWGGEFLFGDYRGFHRMAHLAYTPMPGGEQAIREPWRMAAAYLMNAGESCDLLEKETSPNAIAIVQSMVSRRVNAPLTSSAGRLFDAVAAIAGLRHRVSYEGQAAIELEWLASDVAADGRYAFEIVPTEGEDSGDTLLTIDVRPIIAEVANDARRRRSVGLIARRFHTTMAELIAQTCAQLRHAVGVNAAVLSGGVFMNALLLDETVSRLKALGFRVYRHRRMPPNDGGLCLGQLAIAAATDGHPG